MYAVFRKVVLKPLNVFRQSELNKRLSAFFLGFCDLAVAVNFGERLRMVYYILSVVGVLGHFNAVLV